MPRSQAAPAWAKRGADLRVQAPGQTKKMAMMGAQNAVMQTLIVHTSRTKRSADFVVFSEEIDRRFAARPGGAARPLILVLTTARSTPAS